MNIYRLSTLIVAAVFMMTSIVGAQDRMPRPGEGMGLIWDLSASSTSRSVQTTIENGVKKIRAREDGLKAYIEEDPSGSILVKITKQYGPDDIETLVDEQPELYMHIKAMPTKVGDSEIEISVGVTTKYEADDVDDLKKRHPEAFEVYEKFTKPGVEIQGIRRRFDEMPPIVLPELRLQIDPRGIRIHPKDDGDTDQKSNRKGKEKKDKDT